MTSTKKRIAIFIIVAVYALSLFSGLAYILTNDVLEAFAKTTDTTYSYYYDNLTITGTNGKTTDYSLAKKFYEVLEELNDKGDFKDGKIEYDLTKILTSEQIAAWVENGNLEIPKAFGAARDSFLMDHPELFYIDVYKIMISAGRTGGKYVAYIDSGKEANVYRDNSFRSEASVNDAIIRYNNAVKEIADKAKQEAEGQTSKRDLLLAVSVNNTLAANTAYDFGTYNDGINGDVSSASQAFTAYGALVKGKAVCSGYAMAYKAVMDYLGVPTIIVSGYSVGKDKKGNDTANQVGHSWNYVLLETGSKAFETGKAKAADDKHYEWFAFDVTWNSVQRDRTKFSAMDYAVASKDHSPYEIISSSNYALHYPALSSLNYERAADPNEMDFEFSLGEFNLKSEYHSSDETYMNFNYVNYGEKNATQLLETDGLRLIARTLRMENGEKTWSPWQDAVNSTKYPLLAITNEENRTIFPLPPAIHKMQYAVVSNNVKPNGSMWSGSGNTGIYMENVYYTEGTIKDEDFLFLSQEFENAAYGTYTPAPYIKSDSSTPYMGGVLPIQDGQSMPGDDSVMQDKYATTITLRYDEELHVLDPNKPIEVYYAAEAENVRKYASFVPFSDGEYVHLLEDENGVASILQFKFKPSLMYEHDRMGYAFTFGNVGSARVIEKKTEDGSFITTTSDKTPNYAYYAWARDYIACPCVFGDGRLWIDCCAQPMLVDNSDLSAMDFKDEEGNSTFSESERSQMMLVVNNIAPETKETMLDEISNDSSINIDRSEIEKSQTYDIKLSICGKYPTIPDGSYVKIALGFPEGYGPENEGVTFKLFHRKHIKETDTYVIEEVPCVVTKFGIVATVTSFSPYMVAVVPESKASNDKTVYASIDGKGGKLTNEDGQIQTIKQGGSYTYTIKPDEGYQLYKVTLNGKDVTANVKDGKLTLNYDELANNNELEIQYISNEAAVRYAEKNIVDPVKVVVSVKDQANFFKFDQTIVFDTDKIGAGAIVGIVLGSAAIAAVIALAVVAVVKDKKQAQK